MPYTGLGGRETKDQVPVQPKCLDERTDLYKMEFEGVVDWGDDVFGRMLESLWLWETVKR